MQNITGILTIRVVFSLVSCVAALHSIRAAMHSLKKTGTDFTSARGMDPKAFFQVMGQYITLSPSVLMSKTINYIKVLMMSSVSTRQLAEAHSQWCRGLVGILIPRLAGEYLHKEHILEQHRA